MNEARMESPWDKVRERAALDLAALLSPDRLLAPSPDDEAQAWGVISRHLEGVRREEVNAGRDGLDPETAEELAQDVFDDLLRLGPLQRYLAEPDVEELMVNGHDTAFAIRSGGRKETIETGFDSEAELHAFV